MAWKLASDQYFGELVEALRQRRREQAGLWKRRALGGGAVGFDECAAAPRRRLSGKVRPFVVEGSFFHLSSKSGIARLWKNVFAEWRKDGFLDRIVLLDRAGTTPEIEGVERILIEPHHYGQLDADPALVQGYCDDLGAAAYCSTYYARPRSTPTLALIHDMIPEVLGFDLNAPMWVEKHDLIRHADRFVCISENTRRDLIRLFPSVAAHPIDVALPGISPEFLAAIPDDGGAFLRKHGIVRDYVVYIGSQTGYKGADVLVEAVASLPEDERPQVVFIGDGNVLPRFIDRLGFWTVRGIEADDATLRLLLKGAMAFVNPSYYEGFGLTVLEAFACGCPVICSDGGALPEAAGDAALIFPAGNVQQLAEAIRGISDIKVANALTMRGMKRVQTFSWGDLAGAIREALEGLAEGDGGVKR